jgi:hypothetical protein
VAKKPKFVFRDQLDVIGNLITLRRETWDVHVIDPVEGHPDMGPFEGSLLQIIQDPAMICRSLTNHLSLAYVSDLGVGPRPEGIRLLVDFASADYLKGGLRGNVQTAYPVDFIAYPTPRIDLKNPIYQKKKK